MDRGGPLSCWLQGSAGLQCCVNFSVGCILWCYQPRRRISKWPLLALGSAWQKLPKPAAAKCLSPHREAQFLLTSMTSTPRLLSGSSSPMVYTLFDLVLFFLIMWVCYKPFKKRIPFPYNTIAFLVYSSLVFKNKCFGACLSQARSDGWGVWCESQNSCSSGENYIILRCLSTMACCAWVFFVFFCFVFVFVFVFVFLLNKTMSLTVSISVLSLIVKTLFIHFLGTLQW